MLKIEETDVRGWEAAIRGMRNPLSSWDRSDTHYCTVVDDFGKHEDLVIGKEDLALMRKLAAAGPEHAKFLRMISVTADIIAPDFWFKEFSTYRVGVTENSTSTMHRLCAKEFTDEDFSCEHLESVEARRAHEGTVNALNRLREQYLETKDMRYWREMIELLPMAYNYRRTVCLNYQSLANMYRQRRRHKLEEWHTFCDWAESLPYAEGLIV